MDENQLVLVNRPPSPLVLEGGPRVIALVLGVFQIALLRT